MAVSDQYRMCTRCIYDSGTPGISFDENGVCNYCHQIENLEKAMALVDRGDMAGARDQLVLVNKFLRTYENYVQGSAELKKMDSITALYSLNITKAGNLQADSLKKMQKSNKAANYQLRQKKN